MNLRILLFTALAALALTDCKNDGPATSADPYEAFKADATARWETGSTVENNDAGAWIFITDAGGSLFDSESYKTGRMSADGSDYELIEFDGPAAVGTPSGASLRTPSGIVPLYSLEILQEVGGKLWIVFRETAASPERKIVQ